MEVLTKEIKKIIQEKIYQAMLDFSNWHIEDKDYLYYKKWGNYKIKIKNSKAGVQTSTWDFTPIKTSFFKRKSFVKSFEKNELLKKKKAYMEKFLRNIPEEDKKNILRKMKLDRII